MDEVDNSYSPAPSHARLNVKWICWLMGIGAVLVVASFFLRLLVNPQGVGELFPWNIMTTDDLPVLQSIFTNFGTGFFSAGALLIF
ncbi:hypothetical protein [Arthrobacter sp. NPDC093139]|uniref:hypothetical protein n=1 Tax=Arthrobacter sp. NPDC093139 TaxID=3363945 RepID=UPI00381C01E3